jgi:hypothetical protein
VVPAVIEVKTAPPAKAQRALAATLPLGELPQPQALDVPAPPQESPTPTPTPTPTARVAEQAPPPAAAEATPPAPARKLAATVPAIMPAPGAPKPLAFIPPPMALPGTKPPTAAASPASPKPVLLPPELSTPRTHEPAPRMRSTAVAKPLETVGTSGTAGRPGVVPSTRPVPLMPEPGQITPVPESARRPSAPPSSSASAPPAASGSQPPGGRVRQTTPRMGMGAPFSPTTPGLPGLLPVSEQAVHRLRERIANLDDRDAVTASALWTVEEVLGPAAFVTRQETGYKVHRAGKHFRAIFGEGELVLRPGQEPRLEHTLAVNEAQAYATEGFPLRPVGQRSVPPRVVMLPVMIAGRPAGVFVSFTEKALEVLAGEMPRYKVVTSSVADRLLAILKKKKGK